MKALRFVLVVAIVLTLFSCDLFNTGTTGSLLFKGVTTIPDAALSKTISVPSVRLGSSVTHHMYNMDMKFNVHEIYISQDSISEDVSDTYTWIKVGESDGLKYMRDYEMFAEDVPEGTYPSLMIVFRNEILRYAVYVADTNTVVEMAGSLSEEGAGDTSLLVNYFSPQGSFRNGDNGLELMSEGETFSPFSIVADQTTTIYWKGGAADVEYKLTDFTFDWVDVDGDSAWTPGADSTRNFGGPADTPMWSFYVVPGGPTSIGK